MSAFALRMSFPDLPALEREVANNLRHGRAFMHAVTDAPVLSLGQLVLVHPVGGAELSLAAKIVMLMPVGEQLGVGLELVAFDAEALAKLEAFITSTDAAGNEDEDENGAEPTRAGQSTIPPDVQSVSRQQALRTLSSHEQQKLARIGDLSDRVALERMFGKNVWEGLLHNPKLTVPEVARIARKGTVPKPLLDLIVDNNAWVKADAVRRALLGNPRVGSEAVTKLLRATPKHELKLIHKGTAYAAQIRELARKLSNA